MPIRNCRGAERKAAILARYHLEPGPHCRMIGHQQNEGIRQECCGVRLEEEFYQFFYEPKEKAKFNSEFPRESGSVFVGRHCGKEFIRLLRETDPTVQDPEIFDPLRRRRRAGGQRAGGGGGEGHIGAGDAGVATTPLNREVMEILQLLATVCRTPLNARMYEVLRWLRQHPGQDTKDWALFRVNEAIRDHQEFEGRTLRELIEEETARSGEEWKEFTFHHFESILRDSNEQSYVDPLAEMPANFVLRRLAEVVRLGERGKRLRLEDDDSNAILFDDCLGLAAIAPLRIGDRVLVRVARDPRGAKAVRIYERVEAAVYGEIGYVDPSNSFAFLRVDEGGPDVFIPARIYAAMGTPQVGVRIAVRTVPTDRQPQATWGAVIPARQT